MIELSPQIVTSENPRDWAPIVEKISFQAFYRQLGMVSLPQGIKVISQAIDILTKEKGLGKWTWLLENRVLLWEDIPIDGAVRYHAYVWGSGLRQENTVFTRLGWWRMYFFETALRTFDKTIIGRIIAGWTK